MSNKSDNKGQLICVGTGMTLGAHITPVARKHIEQADIVFHLPASGAETLWVAQMNANVHNLQPYYIEGRDRRIGYQQMVDAILREVKANKKVVGAFYGHPGIFAKVPHDAIEQARALGFEAQMLPGISAEACLFADLGYDPGRVGCQQYEASQFMFYQRVIDPTACLILWQIGVAGDRSCARFYTQNPYRQLLVEQLSAYYPDNHLVALYECPNTALDHKRIEWIELQELAQAEVSIKTTLFLPPSQKMKKNLAMLDRLARLDYPLEITEESL